MVQTVILNAWITYKVYSQVHGPIEFSEFYGYGIVLFGHESVGDFVALLEPTGATVGLEDAIAVDGGVSGHGFARDGRHRFAAGQFFADPCGRAVVAKLAVTAGSAAAVGTAVLVSTVGNADFTGTVDAFVVLRALSTLPTTAVSTARLAFALRETAGAVKTSAPGASAADAAAAVIAALDAGTLRCAANPTVAYFSAGAAAILGASVAVLRLIGVTDPVATKGTATAALDARVDAN